ncbi:cyclophilin-like fold protein [Nonomuraea sp. NPDC051191]|uniref:cyclophilin-like fold protein n=1 Tax=Nonomuraea sp. NPDC051191 TaxID=3364372 RepID=UPI0037A738CB
MKIRLILDDATIEATLNDSAAAHDFAGLLPLTLTLSDYAGNEKVSDLPKKLPTTGSPAGTAAKIGDINYYAPWGNLAIFYQDFRHSDGLINLGWIDSGMEKLTAKDGDFTVTIERA